jgi:hypothetical protein
MVGTILGVVLAAVSIDAAVRPAEKSPLASDGLVLYAVGADRRTIVATRIGDGVSWRPLHSFGRGDIRGLAWFRGVLYVADRATATIYALSTAGKPQPVVVHQGPPLKAPSELTFTGNLIVADPGADALFRVVVGPDPRVQRIDVDVDLAIDDDVYLAGWPGELLMADGHLGKIAQIRDLASDSGAKVWTMQQKVDPSGPAVQRPYMHESSSRAVRRTGYPGVEEPAGLTVYNGIVYVIDARARRVFAAAIHDARAVRLELPGLADIEPTRLIATPIELIALDGRTGRIRRWPRPVPTEIRFAAAPSLGAMAAVYDYLLKRNMLPTRVVPAGGSLSERLEVEKVFPPGERPEPLAGVLCALNPSLCRANQLPPTVAPGTRLVVPDLYSERYVDVERVQLDGTQSLGDVVDQKVRSDEFASYRSERELRKRNGVADSDSSPRLREAVTGTYRVPREQLRFLAGIDARDIFAKESDYQRLVSRFRDVLRLVPLERVGSAAAAAPEQPHPQDPNCVQARQAFQELLKTISYVAPPSGLRPVNIGVAERQFDRLHPDFADKTSVFVDLESTDESTGAAAGSSAPAAPGNGVEPVEWKTKLEPTDHGTAVASLIAARTRPFSSAGLLPSAFVVPLHDEDPGLSQDINRSIVDWNTPVINLSLKMNGESAALLTEIQDRVDLAVFVVAAGNDGREVCKPNLRIYPACWGDTEKNVIVVGGTSLDGKAVHPLSNIGPFVDIVAPAAGFYAAGDRGSYVPVAGTSFSTALVSSTAALLSGLGVQSPALIKQRLVATADFDRDLPEWARRLNVQRAISHLEYAVLTPSTGPDEVVLLEPRGMALTFQPEGQGSHVTVPIQRLRRLVRDARDPERFQVAYADDHGLIQVRKVRPPQPPQQEWRFCYVPLDETRKPSGPRECRDLAEYKDYVGPIK